MPVLSLDRDLRPAAQPIRYVKGCGRCQCRRPGKRDPSHPCTLPPPPREGLMALRQETHLSAMCSSKHSRHSGLGAQSRQVGRRAQDHRGHPQSERTSAPGAHKCFASPGWNRRCSRKSAESARPGSAQTHALPDESSRRRPHTYSASMLQTRASPTQGITDNRQLTTHTHSLTHRGLRLSAQCRPQKRRLPALS